MFAPAHLAGGRVVQHRDTRRSSRLIVSCLGAVALHAGAIALIALGVPVSSLPTADPAITVELVREAPVVEEASVPLPAPQLERHSGGDPDRAQGGQALSPPVPDVEPPADFAAATPLPARKPPRAKAARPATEAPDAARPGEGGGDRYLNQIRDEILSQSDYPAVADPMKLAGTARFEIVLNRAGALVAAKLVRTSGVGTLDDVGLGMIRRAAPFPPVPTDIPGEMIRLSLSLYLGP